MAATYDTVAQVTGNAVASIETSSFTIGSGSNRAYVLHVGANQGPSTTSGSGNTTCGGVAATQSGARTSNGSAFIETWYGVAPTSGSQTAKWTLSASWGTGLSLHVVTTADTHQTTPVSDRNTETGTGTSMGSPLTIANVTANDLVSDYAYGGGGGTLTEGANQTKRGTTANNRATSTQAGADGGDLTWTGQFSQAWILAGVRVVAAASSGVVGPLMGGHLVGGGILANGRMVN